MCLKAHIRNSSFFHNKHIVLKTIQIVAVISYCLKSVHNLPLSSSENAPTLEQRASKSISKREATEPSTVNNDELKFCRNREIIDVPVYSYNNIATIPCWTTYWGLDSNDILFYKGVPETNLSLITWGNETHKRNRVTVEYDYDNGFEYEVKEINLTNSFIGSYTCRFAHSNGRNYVVSNLYRDDYFVKVTGDFVDGCNLTYFVNEKNVSFYCQVLESLYDNSFEWVFLTNAPNEYLPIIHATRKSMTQRNEGFIGQELRLNFSDTKITGLECRVKKKNSTERKTGSIPVVIIAAANIKPNVHNNKDLTLLTDEPNLQLTCEFDYDGSPGTDVNWLRNGEPLPEYHGKLHRSWTIPVAITKLEITEATYKQDNYSCVVTNHNGTDSRTFLVVREKNENGTSIHILYGVIVMTVVIGAVVPLLLLVCVLCKRYIDVQTLILRNPPNLPKLRIDFNSCSLIGQGVFGEVFETQILIQRGRDDWQKKRAILKTFKWPPSLSITQANLVYHDFLREIQIMQHLHREGSHPNVVRYLGFDASGIRYLKVFLVLDHCFPGDMQHVLRDISKKKAFFNDIAFGQYLFQERMRMQERKRSLIVGTSNLMKWSQQLASAMEFIAAKRIVHRDLATRNVLLKATTHVGVSSSYDSLFVQLSDFGMARFLTNDSDTSYVIPQRTSNDPRKNKPRMIPARWYPPESIQLDSYSHYNGKSDVWSFGICLWEMFTLSTKEPYGKLRSGRGDEFMKKLHTLLVDGKRPARGAVQLPITDELWDLLKRCWKRDPERRPSFQEIHQELSQINKFYGVCKSMNHNDYIEIASVRTPSNAARSYLCHDLLEIAEKSDTVQCYQPVSL